MYPYLNKTKNLLVVGLIWSPITLAIIALESFIYNLSFINSSVLIVPPMMFMLLIFFSSWYVCKARPVSSKNFASVLFAHFISLVGMGILWLIIFFLYTKILGSTLRSNVWSIRYFDSIPLFISVIVSLYLISIILHYLVIAIEDGKDMEKRVIEQNLAASKAELKALKTSIHPHFLFNSLAALSTMIKHNPDKAAEISQQLSDYLRYSLRYSEREWVTVGDEIEHVKNYLGIEKARMGERLKIKYDIDKSIEPYRIQPLTLLPLVENAIKHGIANCLKGGVLNIGIKKLRNDIIINIKNPYDNGISGKTGEGLGLRTLKSRLNTEFGDKAHMNIRDDGKIFEVILTIPSRGMAK